MNKKSLMVCALGVFLAGLVAVGCGGKKEDDLELTAPTKKEAPRDSKAAESTEASGEKSKGDGMSEGSSEPSGKLFLTALTKDKENYEITLNGAVTIKNVTLRDGASGEFVSFPRRKDGEDWWNYIKIGRGDQDLLLKAIKSGEASTAKEAKAGFEITDVKIKKLNTGKSKAFVEFHLNGGAVVLFSWKLLEGSDGLWLAAPSEKAGDDWEDVVWASDKAFKKKLEEAAIKAYKEAA